MTITIFANILLDSEERATRLEDAIKILKNANVDQWIFNFRGEFSAVGIDILNLHVGKKIQTHSIESEFGWLRDSLFLASQITSAHVFLFLEDHLYIDNILNLNLFFQEITEHNVEYVEYSFFQDGDTLKSFESFRGKESSLLKIYEYDCVLHSKRLKVIKESKLIATTYLISMVGVFSKELFLKVLSSPPAQPRWHIKTPFDFERDGYSTDLLPMTRGVLKLELFASIDDDHGKPETSLIARGVYPNRVRRKKLIKKNRNFGKKFKIF